MKPKREEITGTCELLPMTAAGCLKILLQPIAYFHHDLATMDNASYCDRGLYTGIFFFSISRTVAKTSTRTWKHNSRVTWAWRDGAQPRSMAPRCERMYSKVAICWPFPLIIANLRIYHNYSVPRENGWQLVWVEDRHGCAEWIGCYGRWIFLLMHVKREPRHESYLQACTRSAACRETCRRSLSDTSMAPVMH